MRNLILIVIAAILSGCGKNNVGSPNTAHSCTTLQGHYLNTMDIHYTIDVSDTCTMTDNYCGYDASYTVPDASWNTILSVHDSNGTPGCMSSTDHICTAQLTTGQNLFISCDNGAVSFVYWKQ